MGRWPTTCSNRISTKASFRISTPSPPRHNRASIYRRSSYGAAKAGRPTPSRRSRKPATRTVPGSAPASTTQTLGDELDDARHLTWRFYAARLRKRPGGNGGTWSGYQAVKHIFRARIGRTTSSRRIGSSSPTCAQRETRQLHVDYAGVRRVRPHQVRRRIRAVVGGGASSIRSGRASSGTRPRFSSNGTIGAASTTTLRRRSRITTANGFRVPLLVISPYAKKDYVSHVQYETTERAALRRGSLRPRSPGCSRHARDVTRGRLLQLLAKATLVYKD